MASILITGASGFIGSFIVEEALKRKFAVWAGIRSSSSKKYLRERKIHFLELDFAHPNELRAQLSGHKGTYNKFDYIVHCAGLTKCRDKKEFDLVNYLQTKYFVDTRVEYGSQTVYLYQYVECFRTGARERLCSDKGDRYLCSEYCLRA